MDRQGDRDGEDPAQVLDKFCFSVFCIDVRIQCLYHKIIEKSSNGSRSDGQYRPPQAIGAG